MLSFTPSNKLEKALRQLQAELAESAQRVRALDDEERRYLGRCALISNVGASTRIENAVLTDCEIDWVDTELERDGKTTNFTSNKPFILAKLARDRERSLEEVVGCRAVLAHIYANGRALSPLTEAELRGLHHELLRFYPRASAHAGGYKRVTNHVVARDASGAERVLLQPAAPGVITKSAMADLLAWYNRAMPDAAWPLLVAVEFEFRFLAIHPFQDGNGRLGRALFILALLQADDPQLSAVAPYIAIDRHIERARERYYATLRQAADGRFHPDPAVYRYEQLAWFFVALLRAALADIELSHSRFLRLQRLPPSARAVLDAFKSQPERLLRAAEITALSELPRRTAQHALRQLSRQQFLQHSGRGAGSRYRLIF
ncbi:MAG: Fic family protein [Gammaproteobacteria bacterium]